MPLITTRRAVLAGAGAVLIARRTAPARAGGVVRVESDDEVLSWDPHAAWHLQSLIAVKHVYETLVLVGPDLGFEPSLATAWRLVKPTVWELELRPGVRFQDGTPLTVGDVAFSLERAKGEGSDVRRFAATIAGVDDAGGGRIRLVTEHPDPLLVNKLSTLRIMSKAWAEEHGAVAVDRPEKPGPSHAREHAMGTGPFRLVEGGLTRFALERAPGWWGRERWPFDPNRIEFATNYDGDAQVADLLAGRADFLPFAPGGQALERLEATPGVRTVQIPTLRVQVLAMNQGAAELASSDVRGRNPFRDKRVRRAMYQAIDIGRLQREGGFVHDQPIGMPLAPGINGWSAELDRRLPYDPAAARALLGEAGYPNGFRVRLDRYGDSEDPSITSLVAMLGEVGIRVEQARLSDTEMNARIAAGTTDLYRTSRGTGLYDSLDYLEAFYRGGGDGDANDSGYSNPEVDALLDAIGTEMSTYARDGLIERAWRAVLDDVVYVPLFRLVETWATRDRLALPPDPRLHWDFRYARFKDTPVR